MSIKDKCPACGGELVEVPSISQEHSYIVCQRQTCGLKCRKEYMQKVVNTFDGLQMLSDAIHKAFARGKTEQKQTVEQLAADVAYLHRLVKDNHMARLVAESRVAVLNATLSSLLESSNHKTIANAKEVLKTLQYNYVGE